MAKSERQLNKEIDNEYYKNRDIGLFLAGSVLGIAGGFAAALFKDLFIGNNRKLEIFYFFLYGGVTFLAIWYINHRSYAKAYKLEKELKNLKKKKRSE